MNKRLYLILLAFFLLALSVTISCRIGAGESARTESPADVQLTQEPAVEMTDSAPVAITQFIPVKDFFILANDPSCQLFEDESDKTTVTYRCVTADFTVVFQEWTSEDFWKQRMAYNIDHEDNEVISELTWSSGENGYEGPYIVFENLGQTFLFWGVSGTTLSGLMSCGECDNDVLRELFLDVAGEHYIRDSQVPQDDQPSQQISSDEVASNFLKLATNPDCEIFDPESSVISAAYVCDSGGTDLWYYKWTSEEAWEDWLNDTVSEEQVIYNEVFSDGVWLIIYNYEGEAISVWGIKGTEFTGLGGGKITVSLEEGDPRFLIMP
ncbi:MAG: hypothetical protein UU77_C0018G0008 [candidate division WWE3 bacterium GW2011_GWC1_41_7]|uniref:Uncharacterized protein n=3 Tax=Katanobacteria TaxID=422282 RepID=A0A0G1A5Z1_UNCKA|nr:MAG: hypothetical protein UU72_C0001G0112 [candidate division WWE3 bacterium GW2011_GWB1_41_6]KKS20733.1 MAG: hypothetical protein UU77_C0018G0008 [candidate division WWE3 bacterium GW2011_GWC1_41_7]